MKIAHKNCSLLEYIPYMWQKFPSFSKAKLKELYLLDLILENSFLMQNLNDVIKHLEWNAKAIFKLFISKSFERDNEPKY